MKSYFIKGAKKRYSIFEDGTIIRHYKHNRLGRRFYKDQKCSIYLNNAKDGRKGPMVSLCVKTGGKYKAFNVAVLMAEYFKLKKPDNLHQYHIQFKDGNPLNCAFNNLEYKINSFANLNFYPQPYYENNMITSKRCGRCGEIKEIKHFHLQGKKQSHHNRTYRNYCEQCRSFGRWDRIKNNPELLRKFLEIQKKSYAKPECRETRIKNRKKDRDQLKDWYVNGIISGEGLDPNSFTKEMKDILRLRIKINRYTIELNGRKNN